MSKHIFEDVEKFYLFRRNLMNVLIATNFSDCMETWTNTFERFIWWRNLTSVL